MEHNELCELIWGLWCIVYLIIASFIQYKMYKIIMKFPNFIEAEKYIIKWRCIAFFLFGLFTGSLIYRMFIHFFIL